MYNNLMEKRNAERHALNEALADYFAKGGTITRAKMGYSGLKAEEARLKNLNS